MNVVIYARYSSHNQTEQSIEGQLKVCYDFAKKNNYTVIGEYIDRATTGTNDNRPEFQKMLKDSSKKDFQGVLVYQLDRFARNRYDSATNKHKLRQNGVRVFSAKENIAEDASGILMESVLEGYNEYFSAELSQKVKRGMAINAEKCLYNGGNIPLGLKVDNEKRFQIDEEKAPIIKTIFDMYIEGSTMAEIRRYLKEQQIKTSTGNDFDKNSIRNIIVNKRYVGIYSYNGKETKDGIPRIIDDNTFAKAQEKMFKNKQAPARARAKNKYLLTTKLFCGHCKEMLIGGSGTSGTGKLHTYYWCKGTSKGKCSKKVIKKDWIENLVIEQIRNILTDENIDKIANSVIKLVKEERDMSNIKRLKKLLKDTEKQKDNLFDSLKICDMNDVRKSIFEEISKMDKQKAEIENQIRLEEANIVKITETEIKTFFKKMRNGSIDDITSRQILIDVLIYRIYLYDDNLTIIFTTQDRQYKAKISNIKEIESSFKGNNALPICLFLALYMNLQ